MAAFYLLVSLFVATVVAQSTFSPARPPSLPLAVRSPYLSTWQAAGSDGGNGGYLAGQWTTHWSGQINGWAGLVRVDNTTYTWMGNPNPLPTVVTQKSFSYTSTRSIFSMTAGPVDLEITFLSPVTPNDLLRQSMPITYIDVKVSSNDGNQHSVQLYTDVSAEWTSGDRSQIAQWSYGVTGNGTTSSKKRDVDAWGDRRPLWNGQFRNSRSHPSSASSRPHRHTNFASSFQGSASVSRSANSNAQTTTSSRGSTFQDSGNSGATTGISGQSSGGAVSGAGSGSTTVATSNNGGDSAGATVTDSTTGGGSSQGITTFTAASSASLATPSANSTTSTISSAASDTGSSSAAAGSSTINASTSFSASANATSTSSDFTATATASAGGVAYHKIWKQVQQEFTEVNQQASWGYWYYATENVTGLTYQSGADVDVRGQFTSNGKLANTQDTNYRAINNAYPVFGFAVDLGMVGSTQVGSVFSLNLAQEQSIQFDGANGIQQLATYWTTAYSDDLSALTFFHNDYSNVASMCTSLDNQVSSDSIAKGGSNYLTLTSLVVRQAFNALAVVTNGTETFVFLKEISSDGDIQTVDVIFPAIPIILYTNPNLLAMMLEPLFIFQESGHFSQGTYAAHDLGYFPNATTAGTEVQQVEESGNMVIMSLAYAQRTGDTDFLQRHYTLLTQWTNYLVSDSLIPQDQISTDDFAGSLANQTNLALKGIIGIQAMSAIANLTGHTSDGANFSSIAASYISQWQTLGIASNATPPHTTLDYDDSSSHGLLYNLYADALLQTKLVPSSVYEMQSNFYPTVDLTYGVPLDTRHNYTKNDWEMWCAAIANTNTTDMFINNIADFINNTPTNGPVTDLYDSISADWAVGPSHFEDRPVVGGWFSLLALNQTGIPSQ